MISFTLKWMVLSQRNTRLFAVPRIMVAAIITHTYTIPKQSFYIRKPMAKTSRVKHERSLPLGENYHAL
ncbi:hypothetical protein AXX12_14990 [Anaerosporomusa subterranea]|uniref:Uncharacterized protein n=1 Tax=Anaerosporomusa subterranea TaxID=1794912 RepID=A0A154BLU4_ANASB|nr:hypothetical protein AXX12_14990 [Anaerosporomusa subterranea]